MIRRWREIERWIEDEEGTHQTRFAEHPLSDFITRKVVAINRTTVPLEQLNVIAKISFGGDLHIRTSEGKRGYKGPLFYAHPGDLVVSKIRVAQGSLCIVPDELEHLAVSAEYPVYSINPEQVSGDFIRLVIRSSAFKQRISRLRSGNTTKARIRPAQFEELKIPLPSLAEQHAFVDAYVDALKRTAVLEQEANAIELAGVLAFETELGVISPTPLPDVPMLITRFKSFELWSHEGMLRGSLGKRSIAVTTCPIACLSEVATVSYGLQKSPANRPGLHARPYLRVANVQRGRLMLDEIKTINVPDSDMPALRLDAGDILFVEGNGSRKELGRVALWNGEIEECIHQNHIIKARPNRSRLLPEFAMAWFNIDAGRDHFFKSGKTTSGLGTINSNVIRTAPIPLPSTTEQGRLVKALTEGRAFAAAMRTEARTLRESAWTTFESSLFDAQA